MTDDQTDISAKHIAANTRDVRARIAAACARARRDPDSVTLIAVSKTHSPEAVSAAHAAGLRDFGENRIQEAAPKIDALAVRSVQPTWHLIGNLQRNKVALAVERFPYIHSVDSERLAFAINERATTPVRVFIEVNVAGESSKHGVALDEVASLAERVRGLQRVELIGLMTVAPATPDPEAIRPVFRTLQALAEANGLEELSMGMTSDYEVAIEEGATFVRVGRAIFGERA